jgi:hypothetical protein
MDKLKQVWSIIISNFDEWVALVESESFFPGLDLDANTERNQIDPAIRITFENSPLYQVEAFFQEHWRRQSLSSRDVQEGFIRKHREYFLSRTRIGRALTLFNEGIQLPELHAFLSMCLVLETLLSDPESRFDLTHKITTRYAKIVGKDDSERLQLFQAIKKLYNARSQIVHGSKLLDAIEQADWQQAFELTRKILLRILVDDKLRELYLHQATQDIKPKNIKKRSKKNADNQHIIDSNQDPLKDYLIGLDLGNVGI